MQCLEPVSHGPTMLQPILGWLSPVPRSPPPPSDCSPQSGTGFLVCWEQAHFWKFIWSQCRSLRGGALCQRGRDGLHLVSPPGQGADSKGPLCAVTGLSPSIGSSTMTLVGRMFPLWQEVDSLLIPEFRDTSPLLGRNFLSLLSPVPESGVALPDRGVARQ